MDYLIFHHSFTSVCKQCCEFVMISNLDFIILPSCFIYILIYTLFTRATGDDTRSLCTTVCKWTYLGHAHMHQVGEESRNMESLGWDDVFWEEIGLGDLVEGHHAKIGTFKYLICNVILVVFGGMVKKCFILFSPIL